MLDKYTPEGELSKRLYPFSMPTVDEYFSLYPASRSIFDTLRNVIDKIGPSTMMVTKSQISFRREKIFAWVWIPAKYLHGKTAPLVLTLSLPRRDASPRWKEVVEAHPGRFTHHLELHNTSDIDDQVGNWLIDAWREAGG